METTLVCRGCIYRDNGKENGNCFFGFRVFRLGVLGFRIEIA